MKYEKIWNKVENLVDNLGEEKEAKLFDIMDNSWTEAASFLGVRYNDFLIWMEYEPE